MIPFSVLSLDDSEPGAPGVGDPVGVVEMMCEGERKKRPADWGHEYGAFPGNNTGSQADADYCRDVACYVPTA